MLRRNIIYNIIGQLLLMILSLVATKYIYGELGSEMLGIVYFSVAASSLLIYFSDLGISQTVTREIAASRTTDERYVRNLTRGMALPVWTFFLLSCAIVYFASPIVATRWLTLQSIAPDQVTHALRWIIISMLFGIPRSLYAAVINGFERMGLWNIANLLSVGVQHAGMIVVLAAGGGLQHVIVWYLVSGVLGLVPFLLFTVRLNGIASLVPGYVPGIIGRNCHFASRVFITSLANFTLGQADKWIISRYLPVSMLGYYGVAQGLVAKGSIVPNSLAVAIFPALTSSAVNPDDTGWRARFLKLQDFSYFAYVPVLGAVALLGCIVMRVVFDLSVAETVWAPLAILCIGQFVFGALTVPNMLSLAMKKPELWMRANIYALLVVLPPTLWLTIKFGLTGAALSSLLYALWLLVYFVPRFAKHCLQEPALIWVMRLAGFGSLGIGAYALPWALAWNLGFGLAISGLVISFLAGTGIYLLFAWGMVGEDFRAVMRHEIRRIGVLLGGSSS